MASTSQDLIYLASPYSHKDKSVQEGRFDSVCEATARLMCSGQHVFSPIAHGHSVARFGLPGEFDYWKAYCVNTLLRCDALIVLMLSGWSESVGVQYEIDLAKEHNIPVRFINLAENIEWEYVDPTKHKQH